MEKEFHVLPYGDDWRVGNLKIDKYHFHFRTCGQAILKARELAKENKGKLIIHRPNGQIRETYDYDKIS